MTRQNSLRLVRVGAWILAIVGGLTIAGPGLASDPKVSLAWLEWGAATFFPGMLALLATTDWRHPA